MFAKLTLSFVDEGTGEVDHAWEAAYVLFSTLSHFR